MILVCQTWSALSAMRFFPLRCRGKRWCRPFYLPFLLLFVLFLILLNRLLPHQSEWEQPEAVITAPNDENSRCKLPPLDLWPTDLDVKPSLDEATLNCSLNGIRYTVETPNAVDAFSLLPSKAWLEQGLLRLDYPSNSYNISQCDLFPIHRLDDYRSIYGDPVLDVRDGHRLTFPHAMLLCQPKANIFQGGQFKWDADSLLVQRRFYLCGSIEVDVEKSNSSDFYNIILLGIDSLSHLAWERYMPKSIELFKTLLNNKGSKPRGAIFDLYNVVGDGTTSALLAILTGYFEQELPESRRFFSGMIPQGGGLIDSPVAREFEYRGSEETPVDKFPWIWQRYAKEGGYATHYIEDSTKWGTFQYRLQGFGSKHEPVSNYARPCMVAAAQDEAQYGKKLGCTASTPTHQVLLESLREFFFANRKRPRFSLTFLSELIHENPTDAKFIDEDVAKLLAKIDEEDALAYSRESSVSMSKQSLHDTVVILFSDHGPRMGKARLSLQGKLEERLPLLGILLPRRLRDSWPDAVTSLQANAKLLCSPFDVHATLFHLMSYQLGDPSEPYFSQFSPIPRGRSLLVQSLTANRSCHAAGVADHWCACAKWAPVRTGRRGEQGVWPQLVHEAADILLTTINSATQLLISEPRNGNVKPIKLMGICHQLRLTQIVSAEYAEIAAEVVRFQASADRDGRVPTFSSAKDDPLSPLHRLALRIHLVMSPGRANFEAILYPRHPKSSHSHAHFYKPRLENIRRLDEYERYASCLNPTEWSHVVRQLCLCR